jgi:hypothetical protein
MKRDIPTWILIWSFVIAMLPLSFSIQGYLDPVSHFPEAAGAGASIYGGPIGLYLARNLASVVITLFALARRSRSMLIIVLMLRAVTDIFDVINNAIAGTVDAELLIFATLWISGSSLAIVKLRSMPSCSDATATAAT